MTRTTEYLILAVVVVAVVIGGSMPVAADHCHGDEDDEEDCDEENNPVLDLSGVVSKLADIADELSDFTGSFSQILTKTLFSVFWQPFIDVLHAAAQLIVTLLAVMPDTTMDEVVAIHRQVYLVSLALGVLGFSVIGVVMMGYDVFGLSPQQVRPLIPRLVLALVGGGAAPWLLKYPVRLSELMTLALAPSHPDFTGMLVVSGELVLVAAVEAMALLALVIVLGMQKIFVLVAAAAGSLIAVLWAIPFKYTQRKADAFIGLFWGSLLIGPFDVIIFRLTLALLSFDGFDVAAWFAGLSGTFLMLGIPYLLMSSGVAAAGPALAAARGAVSNASCRYHTDGELDGQDVYFSDMSHTIDASEGERRSGGNRFMTGNILNDKEGENR